MPPWPPLTTDDHLARGLDDGARVAPTEATSPSRFSQGVEQGFGARLHAQSNLLNGRASACVASEYKLGGGFEPSNRACGTNVIEVAT